MDNSAMGNDNKTDRWEKVRPLNFGPLDLNLKANKLTSLQI